MSEDEALKLPAADGMLVKRLLPIGANLVLAGFKKPEWTNQLSDQFKEG